MEPDSSDPDDVDEDGNPEPPPRKPQDPGAAGRETPAPPSAATDAAMHATLPAGGHVPLLKPQPPSTGTTLAILAQHFDMPQEFATFLRELDSSFLRGDYLFTVDANAYWKVKYSLDHIVELIAGQVDLDPKLRVQMPRFLQDYFAIEDGAEDWEDEIRQKVFQFSKLVKIAGLGTSTKAAPFKAVPADAMRLQVRLDLEPWQIKPEEASVLQVAEIVVQAIKKRRLCVMIIDGSPFMDSPYGSGKSQLLWQVLYWSYRLLQSDPPQPLYVFDGRKDIVYRRDDDRLLRLLSESTCVPFGIDEFDQHFDQREWNKPENRTKVQALQMYRKAGRPLIGACGSIWNNDVRVRTKIATHRCEINKWDDDTYEGEFTLYRKYGPPALQEEKEDLWSKKSLFDGRFAGLNHPQFRFYNSCADKTLEMESRGGLDAWLKEKPDWLADMADEKQKIAVRVESGAGS